MIYHNNLSSFSLAASNLYSSASVCWCGWLTTNEYPTRSTSPSPKPQWTPLEQSLFSSTKKIKSFFNCFLKKILIIKIKSVRERENDTAQKKNICCCSRREKKAIRRLLEDQVPIFFFFNNIISFLERENIPIHLPKKSVVWLILLLIRSPRFQFSAVLTPKKTYRPPKPRIFPIWLAESALPKLGLSWMS